VRPCRVNGSIALVQPQQSSNGSGSLYQAGEGGGEGRCAPCAHTVAPKGPQRLVNAPHPNPLPLKGEDALRRHSCGRGHRTDGSPRRR
jgi:hypothetical protein